MTQARAEGGASGEPDGASQQAYASAARASQMARTNPATDSGTDTRARKRLGDGGERLAATWLEARGYRIVARNWRCPYGELDLVAISNGESGRQSAGAPTDQPTDELVFVEVKTRRGERMGLPEEALTRRKRQHLIAAAQSYLEEAGTPERAFRIDVLAIQLAPGGKLLDVRHHVRAVEE